MRLQLFKTLWGFEGSFETAAGMARQAGFNGLEARTPEDEAGIKSLDKALYAHELEYIAEICSCGSYVPERHATPAEHLRDIENKVARGKPMHPVHYNLICGCDAWDFPTQLDFFEQALEIGERHKAVLSFETHRSRSLFNPWITRDIAAKLPEILLTADYSHWTVVCERILDTEWDLLQLLARQVHHIHARVGYAQGPQVPHPAAPEYGQELAFHQQCWQAVWESQKSRGYEQTSMTPESGPDGYLHTLPFTAMPVAELWEINRWIADAEKTHFKRWLTV